MHGMSIIFHLNRTLHILLKLLKVSFNITYQDWIFYTQYLYIIHLQYILMFNSLVTKSRIGSFKHHKTPNINTRLHCSLILIFLDIITYDLHICIIYRLDFEQLFTGHQGKWTNIYLPYFSLWRFARRVNQTHKKEMQ